MTAPTVFVTGANGYIGNAVCRAFVRAGWTVYGLARRADALPSLAAEEIIPIQGSIGDNSFLPSLLAAQKTFNAIVSTTDDITDFAAHYAHIISLLLALASSSNAANIRPLVLFTSGCKDYGMTARADSPSLSPHTESSPLNPPPVLTARTTNSPLIFTHSHAFDAVLLRPTTVYGRSGSYYGPFFDLANSAKQSNKPLLLPAHPTSILHGTHVDDCAEAYVALATTPNRSLVSGKVYNISGRRYETLEEIANVLVAEYVLKGVEFAPRGTDPGEDFDIVGVLTGFSQWVSSERLRGEVGWVDRRLLFSEGIGAYRGAYEEAARAGHSNVLRVRGYVGALGGRE